MRETINVKLISAKNRTKVLIFPKSKQSLIRLLWRYTNLIDRNK